MDGKVRYGRLLSTRNIRKLHIKNHIARPDVIMHYVDKEGSVTDKYCRNPRLIITAISDVTISLGLLRSALNLPDCFLSSQLMSHSSCRKLFK